MGLSLVIYLLESFSRNFLLVCNSSQVMEHLSRVQKFMIDSYSLVFQIYTFIYNSVSGYIQLSGYFVKRSLSLDSDMCWRTLGRQ